MITHFLLDDTIYQVSDIEMLELNGGIDGAGVWGKIKLKGKDEWTIGDGSYYMDDRHVSHKKAQSRGFKELRQVMKQLTENKEGYEYLAGGFDDGSKNKGK